MTELSKTLWAVYTNTDLTEGRGEAICLGLCEIRATALQLARSRGVQGSDASVWSVSLKLLDGQWYVPLKEVHVVEPTEADKKQQAREDARELAIAKAKSLGLTDDDLLAIQGRAI